MTAPNTDRFRRLAVQLADTYAKKNADYGDSFAESVQRYGMVAAVTRISDKFHRAENLLMFHKGDPHYESATDTLLDLAAYAVMTVMEIHKTLAKNDGTLHGNDAPNAKR